jgi:hypothetical protein
MKCHSRANGNPINTLTYLLVPKLQFGNVHFPRCWCCLPRFLGGHQQLKLVIYYITVVLSCQEYFYVDFLNRSITSLVSGHPEDPQPL